MAAEEQKWPRKKSEEFEPDPSAQASEDVIEIEAAKTKAPEILLEADYEIKNEEIEAEAYNRKEMTKMIKKLAQICEDQEGLDIYQLCAYSGWISQKSNISYMRGCQPWKWGKTEEMEEHESRYGRRPWKWRRNEEIENEERDEEALRKQWAYHDEEEEPYFWPKANDHLRLCFRVLMTFILQIAGLTILFYRVIVDGKSERDWCENNADNLAGKIIVGAFAYYVGLTVDSWLTNISKCGMYAFFDMLSDEAVKRHYREDEDEYMDMDMLIKNENKKNREIIITKTMQEPEPYRKRCCDWIYDNLIINHKNEWNHIPFFIDSTILNIGYYTNFMTLFLAVGLSYFIIFFSESPFDIILNSVAVFFMIEIDDLLVNSWDYKAIGGLIDDYLKVAEDENDKDKKVIKIPDHFINYKENNKHPRCCWKILFSFIDGTLSIAVRIFPLIMYTLPIAMAICY